MKFDFKLSATFRCIPHELKCSTKKSLALTIFSLAWKLGKIEFYKHTIFLQESQNIKQ
jgi:hypothetical protein